MKQSIYVILFVLCLPVLINGQTVDTIFVWDNDRGEFWQVSPAVGKRSWGAYVAWVDSRWGDYDIFRQGVYHNGGYNGRNTMVSIDEFNEFSQNFPDLEANASNYVITVWEDSTYQPGKETPSQIWARIYTSSPFMVYGNERSQKRPAVSCRDNGDFVVTWTSYNENEPAMYCRRYNNGGGFQQQYLIRDHKEYGGHIPLCKPAYCDSGFLVVFEDTSDDGTQRSIYGQYRKVDGGLLVDTKKISCTSVGDTYNEEYPDVATNENGNMVVVWQDFRSGNWDIYCQRIQAARDTFYLVGPEIAVQTTTNHQYRPKVALFANGNFVVVWFESRSGSYEIFGKTCIQGSFREDYRVNADATGWQWFPDIAGRYADTIFVAWQSRPTNTDWDKVYCRAFRFFLDSQEGVYPITTDIPVTPDTCYTGGRKCWYFDDENYDNPATPLWNEDPIDEPDSVYVDLDVAMIDQFTELNFNGQYFIVCEDTLPGRDQDALLSAYDAVFLDLGYRTGLASAGQITTEEQANLVDYIDPSYGDGKPAMVDGNDFGYDYDGTTLFSLFGADYLGDGAPYTEGNIDSIIGIEGLFTQNETLLYDYHTMVDNYIDSLDALPPARLLLYSSGAPTDWYAGRAVFYGSYWKDRGAGSTIYNSFVPAGITSTEHPHTYAEYLRRCIGFLGLNAQPEPITTLEASIGSSEGRVTISWDVVSDDSLKESAAGDYKLKFARAKISSEAAFEDSCEEYFQTWYTGDSAVGATVTYNLYGLPPMDTLVFALKVSDESNLWNTLGAEPQAVVQGDSVTPHYIYIGSNYVKDFSNKFEYLNRRNDDSLFVTWYSTSYFYVGFARCDFRSSGDLFIYVDTKSGGSDSTFDYNGSGGISYFNCAFDADYLFILEDNTTYEYKKWDESADQGRGAWVDTSFGVGSFSEDGIVNDYLYTEVRMPFANMAYNTSNPFKLIVLVGREGTNQIINAFPIFNPVGTGVNITQYYYWPYLASGMVPKYTAQVIGIEEEEELTGLDIMGKRLLVAPNPFSSVTKILFNVEGWVDIAKIKIFDISGRLVREYEFENLQTQINQVNWDGTDELGRKLPGGVYFCQFTSGDNTEIEKVIFIR
jgi:hypothetical protein